MEEKRPAKRTRASVASFVKKVVGKLTGYDLAVAGLDMLMAARRDQVEANLTLFFEKVVRGEDIWSDGRFHDKIAKECGLSDFADLVEAVAREQDKAKMDIYANLYTAFVNKRHPDDAKVRRQMILAAREMTMDEIQLARRVYEAYESRKIRSRSREETDEAEKEVYETVLRKQNDAHTGYLTLLKMERLGFIRKHVGFGDPEHYAIPAFTTWFVRAAFDLDDEQAKQDDAE